MSQNKKNKMKNSQLVASAAKDKKLKMKRAFYYTASQRKALSKEVN